MKKTVIFLLIGIFLGLIALAQNNVFAQDKTLSAIANMSSTMPDSAITGTVKLTETSDGLKVTADIKGIPYKGPLGFHIHEVGNCSDMGKAAGGHFNPDKVMHGMLMKDGAEHAHIGDMGNIVVDATGHAKLEVTLPDVGLENWRYNVGGLSIILHEKADDFGQPTGNAGGRIACGIIEVQK
ncbi:MAG: superoxide dismutase family protein [Candidatus Omnitrophica bacterium]|nr:superoxide dismutase family protein [Candidatus Omnitrophota bacterium]